MSVCAFLQSDEELNSEDIPTRAEDETDEMTRDCWTLPASVGRAPRDTVPEEVA